MCSPCDRGVSSPSQLKGLFLLQSKSIDPEDPVPGPEPQVMTLRQHPNLDLSDHLRAEIVVVDPTGAITCTNRKWEETARIGKLSQAGTNWNYIAECEAASRRD
jgi:hypothetical protein